MDKICSKCNNLLPLSEFSLVYPARNDGKLRADCKECVRVRTRKFISADPESHKKRIAIVRKNSTKAAKKFVLEYLLDHPCVDCGESDPIVLDFDHVRGVKVCDVSRMTSTGYRCWRIKEEIEKCEVRCANCHRRVHAKRRTYGQYTS